jgi:hypothetical protein
MFLLFSWWSSCFRSLFCWSFVVGVVVVALLVGVADHGAVAVFGVVFFDFVVIGEAVVLDRLVIVEAVDVVNVVVFVVFFNVDVETVFVVGVGDEVVVFL